MKTLKNINLSKKDNEIYMIIVTYGNYDDMFKFGYACGRASLAQEQLHEMQKFKDGFAHPKDCPECTPISSDKKE